MSPLQPKTKAEFASQFCPKHWSEQTLRRWFNYEIVRNPPLRKDLERAGYRPRQRVLTIRQQQIILRAWGCPVPPSPPENWKIGHRKAAICKNCGFLFLAVLFSFVQFCSILFSAYFISKFCHIFAPSFLGTPPVKELGLKTSGLRTRETPK